MTFSISEEERPSSRTHMVSCCSHIGRPGPVADDAPQSLASTSSRRSPGRFTASVRKLHIRRMQLDPHYRKLHLPRQPRCNLTQDNKCI